VAVAAGRDCPQKPPPIDRHVSHQTDIDKYLASAPGALTVSIRGSAPIRLRASGRSAHASTSGRCWQLRSRIHADLHDAVDGAKSDVDRRSQIFPTTARHEVAVLSKKPVGRCHPRITSDVDALTKMFTAGVGRIFGMFCARRQHLYSCCG